MTIEVAEKKRKEKKEKKAKAAAEGVHDGDVEQVMEEVKDHKMNGEGEKEDKDSEEAKKERKRRKKEEKERKRKEAQAEDAIPDASEEMQIDGADAAAAEKAEKRQKKKDKKAKRKEVVAAEAGEPSNGEASTEPAQLPKDKKKKRKHTDDVNAAPSPKKSKKEKTETKSSTSTVTLPTEAEISSYLTSNSITISTPIIPVLSFRALSLPAALYTAVQKLGFDKPTPVQACTWPALLEGRDAVGIAETGSGKTLAFGIPALARLISTPSSSKKACVRVLVLAPTRELALQTHDTLSTLLASIPAPAPQITCIALFGGVPKPPQVAQLRSAGTQIVVGTPGRILDLMQDGSLKLEGTDYVVLDEADRMLDSGFENDVRTILGAVDKGQGTRQTVMFSATWPESVRRLASTFLKDAVKVTVGSDDLTANTRVEQFVEVFDNEREKDTRLMNHLRTLAPKGKNAATNDRVLIFVLYKKEATRVEGTLKRNGHAVTGLHGDMTQSARLEALQQFRDGTTRLLVATDVAARGLDIPDVACVLNYSFPLTIEDYIHRIGRTGRGGRSGKSITFFTGEKHERGLAGELARVLRDAGFEEQTAGLQKFPMSIKKKTHSVYGAFFKDDVDMSAVPKRIVFD